MGLLGEGLVTAAGLLRKAFWALAIGYAFSALIQVFIDKGATAKHLGKGSLGQLGKAALLGFISSSCSFAALSGTRALFVKGASLRSSLAYMFASTNLAIEVAILAYIFLGWEYAVALFVGAPILILVQSFLVTITYPERLVTEARRYAQKKSSEEGVDDNGLDLPFWKKVRSRATWERVGATYLGEWKMVYKEILAGFLIAGLVATLVPASFFQILFPTDLASRLLLPLQALLAPVLAVTTVIGSMGNGPLAAILANNGIVFGAIMAFLYADFNVPPAIKIHANYYGWPFAWYIAAITAVSAVVAGVLVHLVFALFDSVPTVAKSIEELATFQIDYTFWLNMVALFLAGILLFLATKRKRPSHQHNH